MLHIDVTYLVIAIAFLALGFLVGRRIGFQQGNSHLMKIGLSVKNPEMWELLHYLVVDEAETQKIKKTEEAVTRKRR